MVYTGPLHEDDPKTAYQLERKADELRATAKRIRREANRKPKNYTKLSVTAPRRSPIGIVGCSVCSGSVIQKIFWGPTKAWVVGRAVSWALKKSSEYVTVARWSNE